MPFLSHDGPLLPLCKGTSRMSALCEHDEGPCGMMELIALRHRLSALAER